MSRYIQSWKLDDQQTIHISKNNKIIFRHRTKYGTKYRGISVDIGTLRSIKDFADLTIEHGVPMRIPLDNQVWMEYKSTIKLYVCSPKRHELEYRFFRFSSDAWKRFIKSVLPDMISFIRDGGYWKDDHRQSDAISKSGWSPKHSAVGENSTKQTKLDSVSKEIENDDEFTPRETYNVNMEDVEEGEIIDYPILS